MSSPNPGKPAWAPVVQLLPLLVLYLVFVFLKARPDMIWDEGRYFQGALNILRGYLASEETLFLWNGPGYPLYLAAYVGLGLPLLAAKAGNALLLFLALVRFHGALRLVGAERGSLQVTYALGVCLFLHGALMEMLMTECLSAYLVCGAAYHYLRSIHRPERPGVHAGLAGLHLGYLALTKVFFGYAVTFGLLASGAWWLWSRMRGGTGAPHAGTAEIAGAANASGTAGKTAASTQSPARQGAVVCGLALALCIPYLGYTYRLTGKPFFWSNSGGSQLYCMTLIEKELLGDWLNFEAVLVYPEFFKGQVGFYRELSTMDYVSRDLAMKAAAIRNIESHPRKYFQNWRANINRMVFGFPVSRYPNSDPELSTGNRSFVYALPFFLGLFLVPAGWARRKSMPAGVHACLGFAAISLGGLSLLSAFPRMVFPMLPLLALWMATVAGVRLRG